MNATTAVTSKKPTVAAALKDHVGTLLWIGPRRHPEVSEVYRSCESLAPQLAYRADVDDACQRPAQCVAVVVFARTERSSVAPERLEHLKRLYPDAKFVCLLSSGCEGELRTGEPWSGCSRIYWHRWNQEAPDWLLVDRDNITGHSAGAREPAVFLAIVAASYQHAEPWLEVASQNRWPATWITPGRTGLVRSVTHVLWDDSAAQPAGRETWRERLASFASIDRPAPQFRRPLHGWSAGFPRVHDWHEARTAGVRWLFSKPVTLSAMCRFVSS